MIRYEKKDIDVRRLMWITGGLVLVTLLGHAACVAILFFSKPPWRAGKRIVERVYTVPPEPRLQANPEEDLAARKAEEDAAQTQYGWVDSKRGIVRIPIEQAI